MAAPSAHMALDTFKCVSMVNGSTGILSQQMWLYTADFLYAHGLLVDVKNRCLINSVTFSLHTCTLSSADSIRLPSMLSSSDVFLHLLAEFSGLTQPFSHPPPKTAWNTTSPPPGRQFTPGLGSLTLRNSPSQRRSLRTWCVLELLAAPTVHGRHPSALCQSPAVDGARVAITTSSTTQPCRIATQSHTSRIFLLTWPGRSSCPKWTSFVGTTRCPSTRQMYPRQRWSLHSDLLHPLYRALKGKAPKHTLDYSTEMDRAFWDVKAALAGVAMLVHKSPNAPIGITTDASDYAIGVGLGQWVGGAWQPLAFFSRQLHPSERKYIAFDCELLCLAIRLFQLEARQFTTFMDHKPLTFSMAKLAEPWSARQQRQLSYLSLPQTYNMLLG